MELQVYNIQGADTGKKATLDDAIFGIEPNDHVIYLDVKRYLAAQRQGTHKAKERAEITGSTRKLKRQKGTGTARAGSIKSPVFRGGGRAFGPRPRKYNIKLNKKVVRLARQSALSYKAKDGEIKILENFTLEAPKTKKITELVNNLKLSDKKCLIVVPEPNKTIYLSSRNLQNVSVVTASDISTYDILRANELVILEGSLAKIEEILKK